MTALVREPEHVPAGDPCERCGLPARRHRRRAGRDARRRERARERKLSRPVVGIDGEGVDLPCPRCGLRDRELETCPAGGGPCSRPHAYTYLSAVDEEGRKLGSLHRPGGLPSHEILAFLCSLAEDHGEAEVFGYSLGYDVTMWVRDLPDDDVHDLLRPERRTRELPDGRAHRYRVRWQGFEVDYLRRRLEVCRYRVNRETGKVERWARIVVWDVFGFYQSSFVRTLALWKTAPPERIAEIRRMKEGRSDFASLRPSEVHAYCDDECRLLACLVRQLVDAHERAALPLRSFHGAGSSASALLDRMGTKEHKGPDLPPELRSAVARAFFGGRFETTVSGPVTLPVWNSDISNAYPYHAARLPCLACGAWRRYRGRDADRAARGARLAVVRCRVRRSGPAAWGPLPWRCPPDLRVTPEVGGGAILWPLRLDETWVWREEYLAARDTAWPGVEALECWAYETPCVHAPFAEVPEVYRERCRIGKEGAGIVLKLANNSVYGKTAQSIGGAPYRSWVWAGCITSGCRAQILRSVAGARDPWGVLMVATDGILSTEMLRHDAPEDTGTGDCVSDGVLKPMGGWEQGKVEDGVLGPNYPQGVFVARPGIYWPLGQGGEARVKSRGIGRSVLGGWSCPEHPGRVRPDEQASGMRERGLAVACDADAGGAPCGRDLSRQSDQVEAQFARLGWRHPFTIRGGVRFVGAKQAVLAGPGGAVTRSERYGAWLPHETEVSFSPHPKRAAVVRGGRLEAWERMSGPSAEYVPGRRCPEGEALRKLGEMLEEQPEGEHEFDGWGLDAGWNAG